MSETVKLKHEDFLKHGFEKIGCHLVKYSKQLVSKDVINEQGLV